MTHDHGVNKGVECAPISEVKKIKAHRAFRHGDASHSPVAASDVDEYLAFSGRRWAVVGRTFSRTATHVGGCLRHRESSAHEMCAGALGQGGPL